MRDRDRARSRRPLRRADMELTRRSRLVGGVLRRSPDAFVPAASVTPVEVRAEQVHTASGPRDAPGDPPMIAAGSDLRVFFIGTGGFEPGDRRVFFLRWTRMWLSDGTATSLLYGDVTRSWVMTGEGTVFPWDSSQRYSLVSGARRGDLSLAGTTCQPSLTLDGFAHVVR